MNITLHKRARTTPVIRRKIQQFQLAERKLAAEYSISRDTVRKWKYRKLLRIIRTRRMHLNTSLTPAQEVMVIELRTSLLFPIDDILVVAQKFLCPEISRSALDRCLRRHGISNLKYLISEKD